MSARYGVWLSVLFVFLLCTGAGIGNAAKQPQSLPTSLQAGQDLYRQYCAACHGADAKGHGPAAASLKRSPSNLTTLAIRHDGKFPYDYVTAVLLAGPGVPAHGSAEMPTWGFIFRYLDKQNELLVRQRIQNLSGYLLSVQVASKTRALDHPVEH